MAGKEQKAAGTIALIEGSLSRVGESADVALLLAYRRAVDNKVDVLSFGFSVEVLDTYELIFYQDARVTFLQIHLQLAVKSASFCHMDRGKNHKLGARGILSGAGQDVFSGMSLHLLAADG